MSRTLDRALGEFEKMPSVTGSPIVESGSNTDGEWTRWADGTQVCSTSSLSVVSHESASGAIYQSGLNVWTFPSAFVAASVPSTSGSGEFADEWLTLRVSDPDPNLSTGYRSNKTTSEAIAKTAIKAHAFGHWK